MATEPEFIEKFKLTGKCVVNIKNVIAVWDEDWGISQWKDKYTLFQKEGIKVQISKKQAKEIIVELDLMPIQSPIFKSGKTWRNLSNEYTIGEHNI